MNFIHGNMVIWRAEEDSRCPEKWEKLIELINSSRHIFTIFNLEPKFITNFNETTVTDSIIFTYHDKDNITPQDSLEQIISCLKSIQMLNYHLSRQPPGIWVYSSAYSHLINRMMGYVILYDQMVKDMKTTSLPLRKWNLKQSLVDELKYHPPTPLLKDGGIKYQEGLGHFVKEVLNIQDKESTI